MAASLKTSAFTAIIIVMLEYAVGAAFAADDFKLSNNQRISCGRGLMAGKLQTSVCRSYAYLFNSHTSEYYRCAAAITVIKDSKDLLKIDTEGSCQKKPRLFPEDSVYSFDTTETEGPNTNAFFGPGGFVIWGSDNTKLATKACFTIVVGGGSSDVFRCVDMKFEE